MGDTGSLFLGGMVVALGYMCKCPIILLPIGIVYVCETMSDIIQIGYFKITHGKRVFKMAPILKCVVGRKRKSALYFHSLMQSDA